jgi:hypothetical protein
MRRRIEHALAKLVKAEISGKSEAVQIAYEELFVLCRAHRLDLPGLLRESEMHRHARAA